MKRRYMCLFLALIMIFQFVPILNVSANSDFHDVKGEDYYSQAAIALASINILTGYPDGSFGAKKSITRAEMATIICKMLGQENLSKTKTMFPDVLESHWASGYIDYANRNGIVNGYKNGEFRPNDTVKFEEALKMIVSSCSYGKNVISQKNDWSISYFEIGSQYGILNDTIGKKGQSATRGDIAVMAYHALQSDLFPPEISVLSGIYDEKQIVSLTTEKPYVEIYYTTDGSIPSSSSNRYTKPIIIDRSCTLKAISVYKGLLSSSVAKADYTIGLTAGSKKNPEQRNISSEPKDNYPVPPIYNPTPNPTPNPAPNPAPPSDDQKMVDADGDKVVLWIEELFGSSDNNVDSDNDGIDDYVEIMILHSNPAVADSDADADEDGLSNFDEVNKYHTDPVRKDTDGDGLTDSEELNKYSTDPLKEDTDNDNIYDGEEVKMGLNPLVADDLKKIPQVLDKSDIDESLFEENEAVPEISGTSDLMFSRSIILEESKNEALVDNRAIVGRGVELTVDGNADLKLSFKVSDSSQCVIMNLTEEEGWVALDTTLEDGKVSASVSNKSGTYCVMDLEALLSLLGVDVEKYYEELMSADKGFADETSPTTKDEENKENLAQNQQSENSGNSPKKPMLDPEIEEWMIRELSLEESFPKEEASEKFFEGSPTALGQADIVFAIDTTASMGDEISNVAKNVINFARTLTSKYGVHANLALVDYKDIIEDGKDSTKVLRNGFSNWYTKVAKFAKTVAEMEVDGGGDNPETAVDALEVSRRLDYRSTAKKFIILITDAKYKNDNNYGIVDMEDEIEKLKRDGIIVSVVSPSRYRSLYEPLYKKTGGIFANIYGNFSEELLKLADLIGKDVNKGNWIILDDYQIVSLAEPLYTKNADTDNDGLKDFEELKTPYKKSVSDLITLYLSRKGVTKEVLKKIIKSKKTYVYVYPYYSNPSLIDTDFDGMDDKEDRFKRDNKFAETLNFLYEKRKRKSKVDFKVDYRRFFRKNNKYNKDLAILGSLYASDVYDNIYLDLEGHSGESKEAFFKKFGFKDVRYENIRSSSGTDPNDITDVLFGHHNVIYKGKEKEVVVVAVRGTNGTIEEWSSNFDLGAESEEYAKATGTIHWDWKRREHHKGFDVAANRVLKSLKSYLDSYVSDSKERVFFVVGHSRGAAIANLLGAYLTEEGKQNYTYTFATPNTTTSPKAYDNIYNIVNSDDFVPRLPMEGWGFGRYGHTKSVSIKDNSSYMLIWKGLTNNREEYKAAHSLKNTVQALADIAADRADCYIYRMNDLGAVKGVSISTKDYPKNTKPYCFEKWVIERPLPRTHIYQSPAFFMQLMAAASCEEIGKVRFATFDVAKYLEGAKRKVILTNLGGIIDPHLQITYYLSAKVIK